MNILWLNWKDSTHPKAGGAEVLMHQLIDGLVADGHKVTLLTAAYKGAPHQEVVGGVHIIRVGSNRYTHSFVALRYYLRNLRNKFDMIVEVVNTAPYLSVFFKDTAKRRLFYHQLARDVWFYETPRGVAHAGYYLIEPLVTFLLGKHKTPTITVSNSTKQDLQRFGFSSDRVSIIRQALHLAPANPASVTKFSKPTILSHGALRAMKRTLDQVQAFEIAKASIPDLQLKISGDTTDPYGQKVLDYISNSPYQQDIQVLGFTTNAQKQELMQRCHIITVTSIKEGWGLIVTEAASQGTPAVVYNVDGLRDSVQNGLTGIVTNTNPQSLAKGIVQLLGDPKTYNRIRRHAWQWNSQFTPQQSYNDFVKAAEISV